MSSMKIASKDSLMLAKKIAGFIGIVFCIGFFARAEDWPQWLGPSRDGISSSSKVPGALPAELRPAWRVEIGGGFSSPVIQNGKVFFTDVQNGKEAGHLLSAKTG